MKYIEFFDAFYVDRSSGGIIGHYGKGKLRVFLLTAGLEEEYCVSVPVEDTASRWNGNDKNPEQPIWTLLLNHFDENVCAEKIRKHLNTNLLKDTAAKLGILVQSNDDLDKESFSLVVSKLLLEIARGCGEADYDITEAYRASERKDKFKNYIRKSVNCFKWMGIHGGEEGLLSEYYVCNTLAFNTNSPLPRRKMTNKDSYIKDATLQSILDFRKERTGKDNQNSLLIGNGGIGKTLMLQHLFMGAANNYISGGKVPVIVQLRDLILKDDDLVPCIVAAFKHFEPSFQNSEVEALLNAGKGQILLDGMDEIDEDDIKQFQHQLQNTMDRYPENQIILASRQCPAIKGIIRRFSPFYLLRFEWEQTELLIDKLLVEEDDEEIKNLVVNFISNGFIKKDSVFATNPMLITFIVENYERLDVYKKDLFEFYEQAYNAILEGHDAEKNAYERIFHSVDDAEDFTKVFREFCALAYMDGIFDFSQTSFEEYYRKLKTVEGLNNKNKMKKKNFFHDICATACMMYEKDSKILYIDPGFQEYLFAAYYRAEETETGRTVGKMLMGRSLKEYDDRNAFDMLMNSSEDKIDVCLFKPFLDNVFRGKSDEEAFMQFIISGYDKLHYSVLDRPLIVEYQTRYGCKSNIRVESINEPKTVILSMLLEKLGEPETFSVTAETNAEGCEDFSTMSIIADAEDKSGNMLMRVVAQEEFEKREEFEKLRNVSNCIRDEKEQIVCFGYECEVDKFETKK